MIPQEADQTHIEYGFPVTLSTSLNTDISLVYCGVAYSNETSTVYDVFMNFFVFPCEIREINKRGVKISCGGSPKITKKINVSPRLF